MSPRRPSRAPNGFGHYQHTSKGWEAWISLGTDAHGKRRRHHLVAASPAELQEKIAQLRNNDVGTVLDDKLTVGAWLRHWLQVRQADLQPATFERHQWAVERHLIPALGTMVMSTLTVEHVELAFMRLREIRHRDRPLSPASQREVLKTLRTAFTEAVRRRRLTYNVTTHVRIASPEEPDISPLKSNEVTALFDVCVSRHNGVRWILALALGLRQSETLGLQWGDIDFDEKTLRVRRQLARQFYRHGCQGRPAECAPGVKASACPRRWKTPRIRQDTKTAAGRRRLHLDDQLITLLRLHRTAQKRLRLASATWLKDWDDEPWLFTTENGTVINHDMDRRDWAGVVSASGISPTRIHDLRHHNATVLLMNGVDTRVVMKMLGWSRTAIAARYQHPVVELEMDAARKVAATLFTRPPIATGEDQ